LQKNLTHANSRKITALRDSLLITSQCPAQMFIICNQSATPGFELVKKESIAVCAMGDARVRLENHAYWYSMILIMQAN
jgi:hypothetical protein